MVAKGVCNLEVMPLKIQIPRFLHLFKNYQFTSTDATGGQYNGGMWNFEASRHCFPSIATSDGLQ